MSSVKIGLQLGSQVGQSSHANPICADICSILATIAIIASLTFTSPGTSSLKSIQSSLIPSKLISSAIVSSCPFISSITDS